jgi:hypothetical protein
VSSWLRLFASAFLRDSSSRSASVRLIATGTSSSGACQAPSGVAAPGGASLLESADSGSPHPARTAPRSARDRTGGGGNRPQRQPLRCQAEGGPGYRTDTAGRSVKAVPIVFVGTSELLSIEEKGTCCRGDRVPTLRPLLAVTGPPRQSGRSPVLWPYRAVLQRVRPACTTSGNDSATGAHQKNASGAHQSQGGSLVRQPSLCCGAHP